MPNTSHIQCKKVATSQEAVKHNNEALTVTMNLVITLGKQRGNRNEQIMVISNYDLVLSKYSLVES